MELELLAGREQGVVGRGHLVAGCGNVENPSSYLLGLRRRGQCGWNLLGRGLDLHRRGLPGVVEYHWFGLRRLVQHGWNLLGRGLDLHGCGLPVLANYHWLGRCGWSLLGRGLDLQRRGRPGLVDSNWLGLRRLGRCG